jgi:hypothetical protein
MGGESVGDSFTVSAKAMYSVKFYFLTYTVKTVPNMCLLFLHGWSDDRS